ncbi:glycosyltransferase family 1 protein [Salipaludibacillus sp. CUR1]|uniref:glycosyltransferase family 4 protein n=1 Tax=Salipaludibacillus sp. CUR1 TaxID=2820003 RepID=UPI001E282CE4|nr:glycosyltransferase family 1 protein [Salipaludibacillus sp. CUR1]MCE7790956.1 glycosyltransferase family 1 protein [Salipaludibacillus sp. CUR1]
MKIAIFSDTYAPEVNGVARTLQKLSGYLKEKHIAHKIYVPENRGQTIEYSGVERLTSFPFLLYPECRMALPNFSSLNQSLNDFSPDLIHIATPFNVGLYGHYFGKKHRIPMVASYHTHFDDYLDYYHLSLLKNWFWRYMEWFHRPFEKVYVPSVSTRDKLYMKNIHSNIGIWGRGVNHQFFSPANRSAEMKKRYGIKEKFILLYVGRVSVEKDVQTVLNTFKSLPPSLYDDTHLIVAGDGPLLSQLQAAEPEKTTFTGFLKGERLAEVYASSDVFIFPSSTETFGNVVLEALSSGLPVIGADKGAVPHLIDHGSTGFLCPPKHTQSFVKHTETLLWNEEYRKQMSDRARKFALTQSWDDIFSGLIGGYEEVLKKNKVLTSA